MGRQGFFRWSPAVQKAVDETNARLSMQDGFMLTMREGPIYRDGEIEIPSIWYNSNTTPAANAVWKRHGLRWDADRLVWHHAFSPELAAKVLPVLREAYFRILQIPPLEEARGA